MKSYTELRGTFVRQDFDSAAGVFVSRPIRHPFLDAIGSRDQPVHDREGQVLNMPVAEPRRQVSSTPAIRRKTG